jgi:hypothetical protein
MENQIESQDELNYLANSKKMSADELPITKTEPSVADLLYG